MGLARDAIKLALLGFRHSVERWGLPTRLEWALAPDRDAYMALYGISRRPLVLHISVFVGLSSSIFVDFRCILDYRD